MEFLRGKSIWAIVLGVLLIVTGVLAISFPGIATVDMTIFLGVMLLIGGVLQIIGAFGARGWGGFFLYLLLGLLYRFVGAAFVEQPLIRPRPKSRPPKVQRRNSAGTPAFLLSSAGRPRLVRWTRGWKRL